MECGSTISQLDRRTIGIAATEIDFTCKVCRTTNCAYTDRTDYVMKKLGCADNFIRRERRIDNYELNWRLVMATQLMGESQVGGSIIGLFLDCQLGRPFEMPGVQSKMHLAWNNA
jgi:hypothetical protein